MALILCASHLNTSFVVLSFNNTNYKNYSMDGEEESKIIGNACKYSVKFVVEAFVYTAPV